MTTTPRDYYDILGITKSATPDEIKKAYRRLARKLHPDLHTDSKKAAMEKSFKELNEAYEVISDEEKRKKYDQYGFQWKDAEAYQRAQAEAGAQGSPGGWNTSQTQGEGTDYSEMFENFFRQQARKEGASFRGFAMPGADLEASVQLPLREFLSGTTRRLELTDATGTPHVIDIRIPKGIKEKQRLRVKGKGAPGRGGAPSGNLYLHIHALPHPVFQKQGADLVITLPLWPWEAALGTEVEVPTLTGSVNVTIPPNSQAKQKLRLKGKGLPAQKGTHGDQFVILEITLPPDMTEQEQKLYTQLKTIDHPNPRAHLMKEASHA